MSGNITELLYNSIESSTNDTVHLKHFLLSCIEHGSFYGQEKAEVVIKLINKTLNSTFENEKGLILLQNFLSHISVDAFSSNAISWMVSCNKIISQKEGINSLLALKNLSKLIKLSVKFPEVNKETAKQIVPKFLLDHVRRRSTLQVSIELLECVQSCMSEYPGPSGEFRLDIVKLLLSVLEASDDTVVAASRCVPLVAGVGGGGKQGVSHKTAWQRQQMALVRLLHTLLNRLYQHVDCLVEEMPAVVEDVQLDVETIKDGNILTKSQRLATQFTTVALFLQAMLLEEFPVAKAVAPDAILDVVAHAQKPTLATLGSSREALAVAAVLPTVQVAAMRILESLVMCLGRNLVPQGGLVCYLCSQVVHWSYQQHSDWPYAMDKPFSRTRHAAYGCLGSWLTVAGAASQLETVVDKLLPPILADMHAEKPSVKLRVGSKAGKGRKKQQVLVNQEDRSEKLGDPRANSQLCQRALLTLASLLRTTTARLKPDTVSNITNTVLRVVAELPVPYSDANCLVALHQLLLTLCLEPHPRLAPPLPPALAAFTAGTHHPDPKVRANSVAALSSLDKIIYPTAATLYFPVTQDRKSLGIEIEDEESHDDESSIPSKRIRLESVDDGSRSVDVVGLDNSEQKSSIKLDLNEKNIEVIDCGDSSDSEEIVQLVPIEKKIKNDSAELQKMDEGSSDEDVDVIEVTEENLNIAHDPRSEKNESSGTNRVTVIENDIFSCGKDLEKNDTVRPEEPNTLQSSSFSTIKEQVESEKSLDPGENKTSEDDADVSQMLMDFTDEVNEGADN